MCRCVQKNKHPGTACSRSGYPYDSAGNEQHKQINKKQILLIELRRCQQFVMGYGEIGWICAVDSGERRGVLGVRAPLPEMKCLYTGKT